MEIKYRGYDHNEDRMYSWDELCGRSNKVPEAHPITCLYSGAGWTVMRYTGKNDKKSIEIYQGDIIRINLSSHDFSNYEVVWKEDRFGFSLIHAMRDGDKYGVYTRRFGLRDDEYYVVGNIYQNKELVYNPGSTEENRKS